MQGSTFNDTLKTLIPKHQIKIDFQTRIRVHRLSRFRLLLFVHRGHQGRTRIPNIKVSVPSARPCEKILCSTG